MLECEGSVMIMHRRLIALAILLAGSTMARTETLEEYAQKCDRAIGATVPDFNCDSGTLVPTTHLANNRCDRPNVLNHACDPGSRFQVLSDPNDEKISIVAHCRKMGKAAGRYGDIAVIQTNQNNGATCFYQALGELDGNVKAPSKGVGTPAFWIPPSEIASPSFTAPCALCHDNGAIIRSPYLNQLKSKPNALRGFDDETFNSDQRYYFVGSHFAPWKAYKVEVAGNICNDCHRMGVNNLAKGTMKNHGTARELGIRATDGTQDAAKNPHSAASPIWMIPGQRSLCPDKPDVFCQENFNAAQAIKACADRFSEGSPLPNTPSCKITQFTGPASAPTLKLAGQLTNDPAVAANGDGHLQIFVRGTDNAIWQISDSDRGWSEWTSLRGVWAANVTVGRNTDHRLEVFVQATDNSVWHNWQTSPNGDWSGWHSLGSGWSSLGRISKLAVSTNADGRLEVFIGGTDNALWHNRQTSPGGGWSGWRSLRGVLTSNPAVSANADGHLQIFVRGTDNALWRNSQTSPNGDWSGWRPLRGLFLGDSTVDVKFLGDPTVDVNADGRLEVFVRGANGALWHNWQTSPNGDWSGWHSLGGALAGNIAVGRNADGGLEVYIQGTDNALWRTVQSGSQWSGWQRQGGQVTNNLVLGRNADGWLQVFVRGNDNELWHNWLVPSWN
jgi:hypothetical protein